MINNLIQGYLYVNRKIKVSQPNLKKNHKIKEFFNKIILKKKKLLELME